MFGGSTTNITGWGGGGVIFQPDVEHASNYLCHYT